MRHSRFKEVRRDRGELETLIQRLAAAEQHLALMNRTRRSSRRSRAQRLNNGAKANSQPRCSVRVDTKDSLFDAEMIRRRMPFHYYHYLTKGGASVGRAALRPCERARWSRTGPQPSGEWQPIRHDCFGSDRFRTDKPRRPRAARCLRLLGRPGSLPRRGASGQEFRRRDLVVDVRLSQLANQRALFEVHADDDVGAHAQRQQQVP